MGDAPSMQDCTAQAVSFGATGADARVAAAILHRRYLTEQQVVELINTAKASNTPLSNALSQSGLLSADDRLEVQAVAQGLPWMELDGVGIAQPVLDLLRPETARLHQAVPIRVDRNSEDGSEKVTIALAAPSVPTRRALEELFRASGMAVAFVAAHPEKINTIIEARMSVVAEVVTDEQIDDDEISDVEDITDGIDQGPALQFRNQILQEAVSLGASDLHFQIGPEGKDLHVRARVDGILHDLTVIPERMRRQVMAVFKIQMADMDVSDSRRLQNGRFSVRINNKQIDVRGATWVTVKGEQLVLRLLDKEGLNLDLSAMGMSDYNLKRFQDAYRASHGSVIVCGPTGSGKSSTLYATLRDLVSPERSILTIEDPVEYQMPGISQAPVNNGLQRDFASNLRNALRCDPDVIMVGEIRDSETAEIAMRAAISGHLLLSTLHAMEAAAAPIALIRMGVPAYQVADAMRVVVSQRLLRRLCPVCSEAYKPTTAEMMRLGVGEQQAERFLAQIGDRPAFRRVPDEPACKQCTGGYKGRTALHEVMIITDEERELLLSESRSALALRRLAQTNGMKSLLTDGIEKAARGLTSLQEVSRVVS